LKLLQCFQLEVKTTPQGGITKTTTTQGALVLTTSKKVEAPKKPADRQGKNNKGARQNNSARKTGGKTLSTSTFIFLNLSL
jgi:hypothetical protein